MFRRLTVRLIEGQQFVNDRKDGRAGTDMIWRAKRDAAAFTRPPSKS